VSGHLEQLKRLEMMVPERAELPARLQRGRPYFGGRAPLDWSPGRAARISRSCKSSCLVTAATRWKTGARSRSRAITGSPSPRYDC
jgi:hypothetical protein